jgi:hypothetical protein
VDGALFDRLAAEEHGEARAVEPGFELVFVMRAQEIAGLPEREVLGGTVEIEEIHHHAHRGPVSRGRFHALDKSEK